MPDDAGQKRAASRRSDYRTTFGSDDGERVLLDLLDQCNFFASSYKRDEGNTANETIFQEGRRNVVLYILQQINPEGDAIDRIMAYQATMAEYAAKLKYPKQETRDA